MAMSLVHKYADKSKMEIAAALERAKRYHLAAKEHGKRTTRLAFLGIATGAGGITAGVLAMKMPKLSWMPVEALKNVDTDFALGGLCQLAAYADLGDAYNDQLNAYGAGLVAAGLARETQEILLRRQQAK